MTKTAEEVIRERKEIEGPPPPRFKADYVQILEHAIPHAIAGLKKKDWEDGDLASVAQADRDPRQRGIDTAIWKLTTLMFLTSRGRIAIKVLDPLGELGYDYAEVGLDYLIKHHSNLKTLSLIRNELTKLAEEKQ